MAETMLFTKRIEIYCTEAQEQFIRATTRKLGISISEYMRSLVREQMEREK